VCYSGAEQNENNAHKKNHRLHLILDCILESFKKAQQPGALKDSTIQLGKSRKKVNLYVPLQFIIGDVEEGDHLCSRYSYRQLACKRLCRTCDVSTEDSGNTEIQCTRIEVANIKQLYVAQDLQAL
jgi:hypothetical protein